MAEVEFSVLARSCLRKRVPNEAALRQEIQALEGERNAARATIIGNSTPKVPGRNFIASILQLTA